MAILRLLAEEGLGADVSTLGELRFAQRAGVPADRLVVHGNNKSDEELAAAADAGGLVVLDALDEPERAAAAGVRRALVRVTPGVEAETHEAILASVLVALDDKKLSLVWQTSLRVSPRRVEQLDRTEISERSL